MSIEEIKNMPDGSISDSETIWLIAKYCIDNKDITLANKIDNNHRFFDGVEIVDRTLDKDTILKELGITGEVLGIFPYGSQVYGTAGVDSDNDYIIVMKSAMLDNGAFRNNAISNSDTTIQGVVYSRGGFIDAINNYEIGALECLSLPEDLVIFKKWPFKIHKWNENAMVKSIITKASASRHNADQQCKHGNKGIGKRGMYHALRILNFGLQLKEHQKIVDFSECNEMYAEMQKIKEEDFDTRDYYKEFKRLIAKLRE